MIYIFFNPLRKTNDVTETFDINFDIKRSKTIILPRYNHIQIQIK